MNVDADNVGEGLVGRGALDDRVTELLRSPARVGAKQLAVTHGRAVAGSERRLVLRELDGDVVEIVERATVALEHAAESLVGPACDFGDVTHRINLTPVAIAEGRALAETLFHRKPLLLDRRHIPTAVFSRPPVACVGLSEHEAREQHASVEVYCARFRPMKATLSGRKERVMVKLVVDTPGGVVLGAHMVGDDAPEIPRRLDLGAATCDGIEAVNSEFRAVCLHRVNALPSGASRRHHSFLVPGLRVYAIDSRGLTLESRALGPATHDYLVEGRQTRAQVTIVREGELIYRRGGRSYTLGPGQIALDPGIHYDERWTGGRFSVLMLDYTTQGTARWAEAPRSFELGRLSAVDRVRAEATFEALSSSERAPRLDGLLELYRGLGLGLTRGQRWEPERELQELAAALGLWMSQLDAQPMWCDFARSTRNPERTLRRRLGALLQLAGVAAPYQGLRALLKVHRLMTAALMMSAANTSVAEVAAMVGYGSARAYCNAARRAGWPTPQATRAQTLG